VTINATERKDYVPPKSPDFTARVATAWSDSLASLSDALKAFAVGIVFLLPWLLLFAVLLAPVIWLARWQWRRTSINPPEAH
jgi:hypothetical protein